MSEDAEQKTGLSRFFQLVAAKKYGHPKVTIFVLAGNAAALPGPSIPPMPPTQKTTGTDPFNLW